MYYITSTTHVAGLSYLQMIRKGHPYYTWVKNKRQRFYTRLMARIFMKKINNYHNNDINKRKIHKEERNE